MRTIVYSFLFPNILIHMAYAARSQKQDHTNVKLVYKVVQFFPLNYNRNMSLKQNQILHAFANGVE